jgi:hypothetical protein
MAFSSSAARGVLMAFEGLYLMAEKPFGKKVGATHV